MSRDQMPCSHWSVPHPHVLARLAGPRPQPLCRPAAALVEGRLLVFVLDGDQRTRVDQLLGDVCVAPEAGVVQRRVAVLVHEVHVRLLSQQLQSNRFKKYFISLKIFSAYRLHDVAVSVRSTEVQRRVIAHVGGVDPRPAAQQQLQDLEVATLGRPVQRRELMVIPVNIFGINWNYF